MEIRTGDVEVYIHVGLALAFAQNLERVIVNSLVAIELIPQSPDPITLDWQKKYDSYTDRKYEKTFGQLVNDLKNLIPLPPDVESILEEAKKKRNFLVHHSFRKHTGGIINPSQVDGFILELKDAQAYFQMVELRLLEFVLPFHEGSAFAPILKDYLDRKKKARSS
jgi:hypothetical protein